MGSTDALVVTVPGTPPATLSPNGRAHHMAKYRANKQIGHDAFYATQDAMRERFGAGGYQAGALTLPLTLHILIAWERWRKPVDDDNGKAMCKGIIDGIADALGINDRHMIVGTLTQERDPAKVGFVKVAIQPAAKEQAA